VSWLAGSGTTDEAAVARLRTLFEIGYRTQ
jgi:hypothetical protein